VHAIEAYVSKVASPLTDIHALEAIKLINTYLPQAVKEPENNKIREQVMRASMEAGLAFSNAILGAVHAMSHSLGGYMDLPHGECNAILLDNIIDYNFSASPRKFTQIARTMDLKVDGLSEKEVKNSLLSHIVAFKKEIAISHKLQEVGVKSADIPILAKKAIHDACLLTNPRKANQRDIEVIYEEAL